jgi:hypothetical protein
MADRVPEPTELIYAPDDSWAPILVAAGVAIAVAGAFSGWPWVAIGALLAIAGARAWWRHGDDEISRMRREQELGTAVIPAEPIRRP